MSPLAIGGIVFTCVMGGGLLGMFVRNALPDDHLSTDTKDIVKLVVGLIGTMAALVLGLLIASAKSSYDVRSGEVTQMSANVVLLDRVMAHYGPGTKDARESLRRSVASAIDRIWPDDRSRRAQLTPTTGGEGFYDKILRSRPRPTRSARSRPRRWPSASVWGKRAGCWPTRGARFQCPS
jgi:hypothetical protein